MHATTAAISGRRKPRVPADGLPPPGQHAFDAGISEVNGSQNGSESEAIAAVLAGVCPLRGYRTVRFAAPADDIWVVGRAGTAILLGPAKGLHLPACASVGRLSGPTLAPHRISVSKIAV